MLSQAMNAAMARNSCSDGRPPITNRKLLNVLKHGLDPKLKRRTRSSALIPKPFPVFKQDPGSRNISFSNVVVKAGHSNTNRVDLTLEPP